MSDLMSVKTATMCLLNFAAFLRFNELTVKDAMIEWYTCESKTDDYCQENKILVAATRTETCPVAIVSK